MLESKDQIQNMELLELEPIEDVLDELKNFSKSVELVGDENRRKDLPQILEDEQETEEMISTMGILIDILQKSNTVLDVDVNVDTAYQKVLEIYEENMMGIFEVTKPYEKTIRSLNLLYENAGGSAEVYVMPVNPTKFANLSLIHI